MEILGIGPSELLFIVIIALIVLGPRDMQKAGKMIGKWLRKIVTSDSWRLFQQTSREIQTLPNRLMREAALDELREVQKDLRQPLDVNRSAAGAAPPGNPQGTPQPGGSASPAAEPENKILPPSTPTTPSTPTDDEDENA